MPGAVTGFAPLALRDRDISFLNNALGLPDSDAKGAVWQAFSCHFEQGAHDRIALRLSPEHEAPLTARFLERIWPVLREDCLAETRAVPVPEVTDTGDDALMWMVSDRLDVAILVLDARALMLRINRAARTLLEDGSLLRRGRGGVFAASAGESRAFREAVAACAAQDACEGVDTMHFLTGTGGQKVPVTLSRFIHEGRPTPFVVAMLPTPPSRQSVERLGREMGLTAAEARVAALIQTGLSNREAAARAGLKEQTFSTYAKRALSKLNVSCRAELAQLLTWQAAGGRSS